MDAGSLPFPRDLRRASRRRLPSALGDWALPCLLALFWPFDKTVTPWLLVPKVCLIFAAATRSMSLSLRVGVWAMTHFMQATEDASASSTGGIASGQALDISRRSVAVNARNLHLLRWVCHAVWADDHLDAAARAAERAGAACIAIRTLIRLLR